MAFRVRDLRRGMTCIFHEQICKIVNLSTYPARNPDDRRLAIDMVAVDSGKIYADVMRYDLKLDCDRDGIPIVGRSI